jgi:Fic family protein|tara:strand:+ start:244 stop:534 length:291 start_codon:yes stop_codon:yes gene_type:complete
MTVLEMMERSGMDNTTLTIAWIKDAIHLIQSNSKEKVKVRKQDIIKSVDSDDNVYEFPADMIALEHVSIKDTSDSKYKRIKRLISPPHYLLEDTSP